MTRPQSSFKTPPQAYDQVRPVPCLAARRLAFS